MWRIGDWSGTCGLESFFAIEKSSDAFMTYKHNLIKCADDWVWPSWLQKDSNDINIVLRENKEDLEKLRGTVDLVAGGPPCQGFSMAGKRDSEDLRNKLVRSYIRFIRIVQPRVILFENVHGIMVRLAAERRKGKTLIYSQYIERSLRQMGYAVAYRIIDMSEFGIPQKRKRFILVAIKDGIVSPDSVFTSLESNASSFCAQKGIKRSTTVKEAINDLLYSSGHINSPDTRGFESGIYGKATCWALRPGWLAPGPDARACWHLQHGLPSA
ncbi:hypothetical protein CRD60_01890 [Bifidobacterium aemilianum]|uniref:Cytosine-specific methyltransferase n=1 Tax=Bifidobacterium aemilianum TaxID=2493120 RepID=A0A366KAJ2_9BIFI|nr:DNA (cytosine-5-)-methyltransferase [Bifidobacterium aemilianum]RBP98619.1 hypothetical protein CRD60_01890 [Bifidobacterium aemilianum]